MSEGSVPGSREPALFETHLSLPDRRQGKVRDVYRVPAVHAPGKGAGEGDDGGRLDRLLVVATDRISAFDVVMPTPIVGKGRLLTEISARWFEWLRPRRIVADHLLSTEVDDVPGLSASERAVLRGRIMLCRAARVVPIECVARGYLAGSGWSEYRASGSICGVSLPAGLREGDRLPEPIFTPATKAEHGHDENIDFEAVAAQVGAALATRLRELTLRIYADAAGHAESRGIILADTKFEFGFAIGHDGRPTDELMLIDEVLTPDSSRFWPKEAWRPGQDQPSFDKQYLREWLQGLVREGRWSKSPPGPQLPPEIVTATAARYAEARRRLWEPLEDSPKAAPVRLIR